MATLTTPDRVEEALWRASIYELFANAFAYPDESRVTALGEAARAATVNGATLPIMRFAAIAEEAPRQALEPVYVSLTTFSSSPDCPAFESAYLDGDPQRQTQRMADVSGFYRAFGVVAADGGLRPDELSVELDFMAYLCRKEAYALEHLGSPRAGQARKAQRLFLERHLGTWASVFGRKFASQAPAGHFYGLAGETLASWIEEECEVAGVQAEQVSGDAQSWPLPVSHGPEFAGNASFVPMEELEVR